MGKQGRWQDAGRRLAAATAPPALALIALRREHAARVAAEAEGERLAAALDVAMRDASHAREQLAELQRFQEDLRAELLSERERRLRVERAHRSERHWARELRDQVAQLHRQVGTFGHTDTRELVLSVAMHLVEADKGLLLSRRDRDDDGNLDLVCALGFETDVVGSAVAQQYAAQVLRHDETVREDDSRTLRAEGRTAADEEIECLLAVPVYIQDDFGGVVLLANREGGFEGLDDEVLLALGDHAGAVLENGDLHGELRNAYVATVRMLAEAIEVKDPEVRLHSEHVAAYVAAVADRLELEPARREELVIASLLHDVGKIGISERILLKPGRLTPEERSTIELHPHIGYRLVQQVPALDSIAPAVLHHHERFDGNGYPDGLSSQQIPLEARVICVADSFSAMTSKRPYQPAMEIEEACAELERCAGTQFDPQVVRLFVEEVRRNPFALDGGDAPASVLDDPELQAHREPGEPVLGFGPVSATDNLTLLYSHRYLHEAAAAQAERSHLQGGTFAVVLVELDGLPELNERDGYAAGDKAIQEVARSVQRAAGGAGGKGCRFSGRRLALLVGDADEVAGRTLAQEILHELNGGPSVRCGVGAWREGDSGSAVIERARLELTIVPVDPGPVRVSTPPAPA